MLSPVSTNPMERKAARREVQVANDDAEVAYREFSDIDFEVELTVRTPENTLELPPEHLRQRIWGLPQREAVVMGEKLDDLRSALANVLETGDHVPGFEAVHRFSTNRVIEVMGNTVSLPASTTTVKTEGKLIVAYAAEFPLVTHVLQQQAFAIQDKLIRTLRLVYLDLFWNQGHHRARWQ